MKFADLRNDGDSDEANVNYPRFYLPKDAFIAYDNSSIAVQDVIGRQELAVERAVERAEKDKAMEIARNLKALGVANADIAKATGLDEEEIEGDLRKSAAKRLLDEKEKIK